MIRDLVLYSAVTSNLKRKVLFKGTFFSFLAIFLWVVASFIPENQLLGYGWLFYLVGILLLVIGLLPYRKLQKIETNPDKIEILNNQFRYYKKQVLIIAFPVSEINKIEFVESREKYGIKIDLKSGKSIFIPYFTDRTNKELHKFLYEVDQ